MISHNLSINHNHLMPYIFKVSNILSNSSFQKDGDNVYIMVTLNVSSQEEGKLEAIVQANMVAKENNIDTSLLTPVLQSETYINNKYTGIFLYNTSNNNLFLPQETYREENTSNGGLNINSGLDNNQTPPNIGNTTQNSIAQVNSENNTVVPNQGSSQPVQSYLSVIKLPKWILVIPVDLQDGNYNWNNKDKWDQSWLVPQKINNVNLVALYGDTLDKKYLTNNILDNQDTNSLISAFSYLSNKYKVSDISIMVNDQNNQNILIYSWEDNQPNIVMNTYAYSVDNSEVSNDILNNYNINNMNTQTNLNGLANDNKNLANTANNGLTITNSNEENIKTPSVQPQANDNTVSNIDYNDNLWHPLVNDHLDTYNGIPINLVVLKDNKENILKYSLSTENKYQENVVTMLKEVPNIVIDNVVKNDDKSIITGYYNDIIDPVIFLDTLEETGFHIASN